MSGIQSDISKYIEGLAQRSRDIFWIKNSDFTKQIYISPAYETIWGRSCESMYADPMSWTEYILPEDLQRLMATVARCRENITPDTHYIEVYRVKRPDGKMFWMKEEGFSIYDSFQNLIGFGGVAEDITDQKDKEKVEAEKQVLTQERDTFEGHLRSIIESIAGNHWWKDINGVYRGYNRTLLKMLGYESQEEIIGKTDYELPWADQADCLVALDKEVMRRGVAIEREELVTSNSGDDRVYLVNKAPLRDKNGNIIGTIGHGFDITDLKHAQAELEFAKVELEKEKGGIETRLSVVTETIIGNHWWKDINGRYLGCNDEFAKLYGLESASEVVGKTDYELPWVDEADDSMDFDHEVIKKGEKITKETQNVVKDGELRYFIVSKAPLRDENGVIIGIIGNSTDITEQKRIQAELKVAKERAEAASRAKSSFLAVISHELRTPLNGILGTTQILDRKVHDRVILEHVSDIEKAATSLLTLVNDILDSARLEQGKFKFVETAFELRELVNDTINNIDYRLIDKPIEIKSECDKELPGVVIGDAFRLKQVLLNLIDNAIKFTDSGTITLSVMCETYGMYEVELLFKVKDTGIGISEEMRKKIFHRFAQVDSAYGRAYRGIGLGLAICKQIVEAMDGEIHVDSEVGKGSCFWFRIPFKLPIEPRELNKPAADNLEDLDTKLYCNCRVLLVEDNPLNQKVTKVLLEDLGCTVDIAVDGKQAIKKVNENDYHIIFMDVGLPEMDGMSVAKEMRCLNDKKDVPIVALTAHVMEDDIQKCYQAQMNEVLTKPITVEQLKKALFRWCGDLTREGVEISI